jgi:hypothetical protein
MLLKADKNGDWVARKCKPPTRLDARRANESTEFSPCEVRVTPMFVGARHHNQAMPPGLTIVCWHAQVAAHGSESHAS